MGDRAVNFGKDILSAEDMIDVVSASANSKVSMYLITESDINKIDNLLTDNLKPTPNSSKIHQLIWSNLKNDKLFINYLSCTSCIVHPPCIHYPLKPDNFSTVCVKPIIHETKQKAVKSTNNKNSKQSKAKVKPKSN